MSKQTKGTLNVDALVEEARRRTGLSDFGSDTWQEGLGVPVKSCNEESALTAPGRHGARSYDPARFGVNPAELKQRFAFSHTRFPELTRKPNREEA